MKFHITPYAWERGVKWLWFRLSLSAHKSSNLEIRASEQLINSEIDKKNTGFSVLWFICHKYPNQWIFVGHACQQCLLSASHVLLLLYSVDCCYTLPFLQWAWTVLTTVFVRCDRWKITIIKGLESGDFYGWRQHWYNRWIEFPPRVCVWGNRARVQSIVTVLKCVHAYNVLIFVEWRCYWWIFIRWWTGSHWSLSTRINRVI